MRQDKYKTVDELPDLIKEKKTSYQSVDELPDLKKKSSGGFPTITLDELELEAPSISKTNDLPFTRRGELPEKVKESSGSAIIKKPVAVKSIEYKFDNKPVRDNVIPNNTNQIAKKESDYLLNERPKEIKVEAEKLKTTKPTTETAFDGMEFMKQDIINNGGGESLKDLPTNLESLNLYFDNDATNAAGYFKRRLTEIDENIREQKQEKINDTPRATGDIADGINKPQIDERTGKPFVEEKKIIDKDATDLVAYRKKLVAAQSQLAKQYSAWLTKGEGVTEKGKLFNKIMGDEHALEQERLEAKGIPIKEKEKYDRDIKGLEVAKQELNNDYEGKDKDDTYYEQLAQLNSMDKAILNKYPEYKKEQVGNLIAKAAVKDPKLKMLARMGSGELDNATKEYLEKTYGLSKKDLKGFEYGDIPSESFLGNIAKGLYNAGSSVVTGAVRAGGSLLGVDEDRLTSINESITESGDKIFGNNPYEHLQDPDGKYNLNITTAKNAIGSGIGSFVGFLGGVKLASKALSLADDAAMGAYLIGSGNESHYQEGGRVLGKDASEFEKELYATGMGFADWFAFKFFPKDKLHFSQLAKKEFAKSLEGMSISSINKEAIESGYKKLFKGALNTAEETAKIGGAMSIAQMAKTATNVLLGEDEKANEYVQEGVENIEHMAADLAFSMGIPLGLMEIPKYRSHSNRTKQTLLDAGENPGTHVATIRQAEEKGIISKEEADKRIEVVETMRGIVKSMPETNPLTGEPLKQNDKREYAYNRVKEIAIKAKEAEVKDAALAPFYKKEAKELVDERTAIVTGTHEQYKETATLGDRIAATGKQKQITDVGTKSEVVQTLQEQALNTPTSVSRTFKPYDAELTTDLIARNEPEAIKSELKTLKAEYKKLIEQEKKAEANEVEKSIVLLEAGLEKQKKPVIEEVKEEIKTEQDITPTPVESKEVIPDVEKVDEIAKQKEIDRVNRSFFGWVKKDGVDIPNTKEDFLRDYETSPSKEKNEEYTKGLATANVIEGMLKEGKTQDEIADKVLGQVDVINSILSRTGFNENGEGWSDLGNIQKVKKEIEEGIYNSSKESTINDYNKRISEIEEKYKPKQSSKVSEEVKPIGNETKEAETTTDTKSTTETGKEQPVATDPAPKTETGEAGKEEPPKKPTEPVEEGEGDKFKDKGILNRLFKAENTPKEAKVGFEEKGLKYEPQSTKEAEEIGKAMVDQYGIEDAITLAETNKFKGGVNSAIFAESLNRLFDQEAAAKTPQEKIEIAKKFAEVGIRYDEFSRGQGRDIKQISHFYKKSPLGVQIMENAKRKEDFEQWSKPKDKSWKEFFDEMLKEPEFKEEVDVAVKEGMKKERAAFRAEKKEKVHKAIDETIDKWIKKLTPDSTKGASTKGGSAADVLKSVGATMKKAYDAGESISEVIRTAIEAISEKLGITDWDKEGFRKDWESKLGKDKGYKDNDTMHQKRIEYLKEELKRITERRRKEPKEKKESTREIPEDEKLLLEEIEKEQSSWDAEKDAARQLADDYGKMETERNRQLKRVGELNEKIQTLREGRLPETKVREPKVDTPEIEALKIEKDALEKSVRESIAQEKKMKDLEQELQRLKDRKEREPKPDNKRVIGVEERLLRDEIEAERKAWKTEKNIEKLYEELQMVKTRMKKVTIPKQKKELSIWEMELQDAIKAEKAIWAKEIEPEKKVRAALKATQKSLEEYERRISEGDISKVESDTPETPELKSLREKRDAKRKEYEEMKKEMTKPTEKQINDKILDRFRKKLKGLTDKEKEEVVRKSFQKIVESGGLDYADFKKIIADITGRGDLTPEEATRLKELVKETNAVDEAAKKSMEGRKPELRVAYFKQVAKAAKATRELNELLNNRPNITKRLTSIMQLNTLGIPALVNNPIYNIINQIGLRVEVGAIQSLMERAIQLGGKAFGKDIQPEINIFSLKTQAEFFKKLGLGVGESIEQFGTGLSRADYTAKELHTEQIRPWTSIKDLWKYFKGEKNLTGEQVADKIIQATVGIPAEGVARTLNLGDKPQRFAAQGNRGSAFAKALGLKDIDYDLFIDFPREEALMQYKKQGLSDVEAAKKADYIADTIIKEGQRSTFQQDNMLNDMINRLFGGEQSGIGSLAKAVTISPYIKIPSNAYWSYYNLINPEVAFLQSMIYGAKAYAKKTGKYTKFLGDKYNTSAAKDLNEAKYWFAHGAVGMATRAVIVSLVGAGVARSSNTGDDTKKEREGEANYEQQGTINVSKLSAAIKGENPDEVKNGLNVQMRWFGHWGTMANAIARKEEEMTPEQREEQESYWATLFGGMEIDALKELNQGVFGGTSSMLTAIERKDFQNYGVNLINMFTNVVQPAALAQIERAAMPYYTKQKADTFLGELNNTMLTRSKLYRDLTNQYPPSKVGIWGDKVEKTDNFGMRLFGISKAKDDNFAQPIYEDYKKTSNTQFLPPSVKPEIRGNDQIIKLPTKDAARLEELVGQQRKLLVAPYINDMATFEGSNKTYSQLTDEEKIKKLDILYEEGFKSGKAIFLKENPQYLIPEETKQEKRDKKKDSIENRKFRKAVSSNY